MALPGVVWMVIFCFIPIYGISIAFLDYNITKPISVAPFVGFKYFIEFFTDENFPIVMRNTVCISLLKLAVGFPLPSFMRCCLTSSGARNSSAPFKRYPTCPTSCPGQCWAL